MATLKDVAKASGVSVTTASYALKNDGKISEETAERVREAARMLNYVPSGFARSLKANKTNNIGVFLHGFAGPVYGEILSAIHTAAADSKYEIMVCSTMLSNRLLMERHTDGAIVLNSFIPEETLAKVQSESFPMVVMDRIIDLPYVSCVVADNVKGGYMAAKYLLESGHRRIGIISGSKSSYENQARLEGVKNALIEAGIDFSTIPVVEGSFEEERGRAAMMTLLESHPEIDGLFCCNDEMAVGAMSAIKASGRSVPGDIAVIGYDDIPVATHCSPSLTTIRVDKGLWGYLAASTLIDMIANKTGGKTIKVSVELIRRQSVGKVEMGIG